MIGTATERWRERQDPLSSMLLLFLGHTCEGDQPMCIWLPCHVFVSVSMLHSMYGRSFELKHLRDGHYLSTRYSNRRQSGLVPYSSGFGVPIVSSPFFAFPPRRLLNKMRLIPSSSSGARSQLTPIGSCWKPCELFLRAQFLRFRTCCSDPWYHIIALYFVDLLQ